MIYLDHHAASPLSDHVRRAMDEARAAGWANPSSTHQAGRASRALLEDARAKVAAAIGAKAADLVLTGGGTEACNLGLLGLAGGSEGLVTRVVSTDVEHPAVARAVDALAAKGVEVVRLACLRGVPPTPDEFAARVGPDTLVAIQWVNNETGTVFPVADYGRICRAQGAAFFVDATQALGKLHVSIDEVQADALAFAAQKIGGPAGAGALWVRRNATLAPVLHGGEQERGRRPGTLDVVAAAGFGVACEHVPQSLAAQKRIAELRDGLERALMADGASVNGEGPRVATASNVSFAGWKGAVLTAALDLEGVCVSTGAACSSGLQEPSRVIGAMYPNEQWRAGAAVRISLGTDTDSDAIDLALQAFRRVLSREAPNMIRI